MENWAPAPHFVYMSPQGTVPDPGAGERAGGAPSLCIHAGITRGWTSGRSEALVDEQISIGDYVLTGGELPAMVLVDCVSRMVPGVLADEVCFTEESHFSSLLEYPQYTRPAVWEGREVPEVLLSGHHANIAKWRREQSLLRTMRQRPDLLEKADLTEKERLWVMRHKLKEETGRVDSYDPEMAHTDKNDEN